VRQFRVVLSPVVNSSMESPNEMQRRPDDSATNQGLLDLSVELSSPQVFSGTKFAIYLHIKNPFSKPIWIRDVRTNLPASVLPVDGLDSTKGEKDKRRRSKKGD
jgi:hypothetical protein